MIAIWMFVTAFGAIIGISAITIFAFPYTHDSGGIFGLTIAAVSITGFLGIAVAGGIGLLMGKNWGRILVIIHSALVLLWIPIGTVIGILAIIYLGKDDIRDYFEDNR